MQKMRTREKGEEKERCPFLLWRRRNGEEKWPNSATRKQYETISVICIALGRHKHSSTLDMEDVVVIHASLGIDIRTGTY